MNKQLLFVKRPVGEAGEDTWDLVSNPIPEPKEGDCFDFLPTRAQLDIAGWADHDIFSHS